ncbi:MAG TPA: hypothetical protein G4O00_14395 [Thermoflexia bacterium]|nr:hypothetical protein [Thermoflexia bacterium]
MRRIRVADGLVLEVRSGDEGNRPLVRLRMTAWREGELDGPGEVVVYPDELDALMAALTDAAVVIDAKTRKEAAR